MNTLDALVLGKGPAGLAAAAALSERGMRVGVLGPTGAVHWPARYGAWLDELTTLGLPHVADRIWPEAVVGFGDASPRVLQRSYVFVDNGRLIAGLLDGCERGRVRWMAGEAIGAHHHDAGSVVRLRDGREIAATLVMDASGHRPALVQTAGTRSQGFQTAIGWTLDTEGHPFQPGQATLMDWDARSHGDDGVACPSFLYAMPLDDRRVFVEETVLVSRPAVPFEVLEERLRRRCAALGIATAEVVEREQVWIPMGGGIPSFRQRVVGFGGAAGMVHPATGYLLPRVLGTAPVLADAIADALGEGASPVEAAYDGWNAIWPADRRRRHALFRFGMETVLKLDATGMQNFFRAFFDLPQSAWEGYLGDRLPADELARVMGSFFLRAPAPVKRRLAASAIQPHGVRLAGALLASWTAAERMSPIYAIRARDRSL